MLARVDNNGIVPYIQYVQLTLEGRLLSFLTLLRVCHICKEY